MKLIALLMLIPFLAFGEVKSKIGADTVNIGVAGSSNDVKLNFVESTQSIRANKVDGKLQFTNDQITWKDIGSGGAGGDGGINIISNPSYEDNVSIGWTNSGGTFTQESYTDSDGVNTKFARFVASGSGEYARTTALVIPDFLTGACIAYIGKYKTTTNNTFLFRLLDSSFNIIDSKAIATSNGSWTGGTPSNALITFPCPAIASTIYVDVISTAVGTIDLDLMYAGSENRLVNTSKDGLIGYAYFPATSGASCSRTNSSFGPMTCTTAMPAPTINYSSLGSWQSIDSDLPRVTVNNLPAGTYKATFIISGSANSASSSYTIYDGTSICQGQGGSSQTQDSPSMSVVCLFNYSSSGNRNFEIYAMSAGTASLGNGLASGYAGNTKFLLELVSGSSDKAISQSQSEWMIDVSIGGANPSFSATSSYTELTSGSFDMVINGKSAPAKIPCSSTNASTGLTCSAGNEGVGLVFNPPYSGLFQVCAQFQSRTISAVSYSSDYAFQLMLTQNSSQTIISEGKEKSSSFFQFDGYASSTSHVGVSNRLCGVFNFSDTSEKTIRLMYELSGSNMTIIADRSASVGQRDIHFTVIPLKAGITPMKTGDTVTSSNMSNPKTISFEFGGSTRGSACNSNPCTMHVQNGISGMTTTRGGSAGDYTVNFPSGFWKDANYICSNMGNQNGDCHSHVPSNPVRTTTSMKILGASSVAADVSCTMICHGEGN